MHHSTGKSPQAKGHRPQTGAWYLFGLSCLTVFLLAIFLFGGLAREHEFQTDLQIRTRITGWRISEAVSPAQISREITDNENLSQVLAKAGYFSHSAAKGSPREQALSDLLKRLLVQVRQGSNGDLHVQIRYNANDPALGAAVVNHLVNEYATRHRERVDRELRGRYTQARERAEQARRVVAQCEAEVETFLEQVFPRSIVQQAGPELQQSSHERHPLAVVLAAAEMSVVDGELLQEQILELEQQRRDLLRTRTQKHPAVQALDKEIAQTRQRLEEIEERSATPVTQAVPDHGAAAATGQLAPDAGQAPRELERMLADQKQAARTFHFHRRRLERHLAELSAAEEEEQLAWRTHREARAVPLVAWSPATGKQVLNPPRWKMTAMAALAAGLVAAGGLTWTSMLAWRTYTNPSHLQSESGIPLAAMLKSDRRLGWSPRGLVRQAVGGWRIFCELALAGCVVWVLVMSVADSQFATEFVQDPLAQLAGGAQRTAGLWGH